MPEEDSQNLGRAQFRAFDSGCTRVTRRNVATSQENLACKAVYQSQAADALQTPPTKRRRGRPPGSGKWQKLKKAQEEERTQICGTWPPVQLVTDAESSQVKELTSADQQLTNEVDILQKNADQTINPKASNEMVAGVATVMTRSSLEIIDINPLAESSPFLSIGSAPMKEHNELVSTIALKEEAPDATSHEDQQELGLLLLLGPTTKEGQRDGLGDIKQDPSDILQAIMNKHGDITKECTFHSEFYRTLCLEGICRVVQKLQATTFSDMQPEYLNEYFSFVKDAENVKLNMKWLHQFLEELAEAVKSRDEIGELEAASAKVAMHREAIQKTIEMKRVEAQNLESEIQGVEEDQGIYKLRVDSLKAQIKDIQSKCRSFRYLMDGLF